MKTIIIYTAMGVGITLIVFSVFVGINEKEKSHKVGKADNKLFVDNNSPENDYQYKSKKEEIRRENNLEPIDAAEKGEPLDGSYEGFENIEPQKKDESEFPPKYKYESKYGKEDVEGSKRRAMEFVKVFYNFNGKYPLDYVEKSKSYMSEKLYSHWKENPESGTMVEMYRKFIDAEIYEPFGTPENTNEIVWIIKINGEVFDYEKEESELITDVYSLLLEKINGKWMVVDILINAPY